MKKIVKVGFPIVCVVIIGGTFILMGKTANKIKETKKSNTNIEVNETKSEVKDKDMLSTSIKAGELNSTAVDEMVEVDGDETENSLEEQNYKKACEIAKKKDEKRTAKVYYTNEGIEDGKYIVAVRLEETTEAINYYLVDIDTEKVEIYN